MADGEEQEQIVLNCTQRRTDMANEAAVHSKKTTNSNKACHKNRPNPQQKGKANLVRTQAPSDSQQAKKKEYLQHKMKNSQPNSVKQLQLKTPISAKGLIIPSQVRHKKPHNHSRNANRAQKGHKTTENTQHKNHVCSPSPCQNNQMRGSQVHKNVEQERQRQTGVGTGALKANAPSFIPGEAGGSNGSSVPTPVKRRKPSNRVKVNKLDLRTKNQNHQELAEKNHQQQHQHQQKSPMPLQKQNQHGKQDQHQHHDRRSKAQAQTEATGRCTGQQQKPQNRKQKKRQPKKSKPNIPWWRRYCLGTCTCFVAW
jgi:hypothetical protein